MSVPPPPGPHGPYPGGEQPGYGQGPGPQPGHGPPPGPPPGGYPQQPPPGGYPQQPGWQQQPPPAGQQPGYGGFPPAPPPQYPQQVPQQPSGRNPKKWLRIAVPIVVAVLVGTFGILRSIGSPEEAEAGDCLAIAEFSDDSDAETVECTDPSANVQVAVKLDDADGQCPGENYDQLVMEGGASFKLCLMLHVSEGECLTNLDRSTTKGYETVPCADPAAQAEVLKIVEGDPDAKDACAQAGGGVLGYPEPPRSICLRAPQNA
ncbi:LppU/SCO3897 family protein [Amycolatopsis aidingensis]|uniref:LppU/SCO3897 family protein n=1 Tax=Amycolatopsis aidingensis TaxID=2842453 RepID=UPI001C0D7439|nr:hypothetical protein [Amycolatopsis aidingensis]